MVGARGYLSSNIVIGKKRVLYPKGERCQSCETTLTQYRSLNICQRCEDCGLMGKERKPLPSPPKNLYS